MKKVEIFMRERDLLEFAEMKTTSWLIELSTKRRSLLLKLLPLLIRTDSVYKILISHFVFFHRTGDTTVFAKKISKTSKLDDENKKGFWSRPTIQ